MKLRYDHSRGGGRGVSDTWTRFPVMAGWEAVAAARQRHAASEQIYSMYPVSLYYC